MAIRLLSPTGRKVPVLKIIVSPNRLMGDSWVTRGSREIVGYGMNGEPNYVDITHWPMPAIRYKENTPEIQALREKEKGDWKKLSIDEKKCLYRSQFRQTFKEFTYTSGEWKSISGIAIFLMGLSFYFLYFYKAFVYTQLPITMRDEELRRVQMRRIIDMQVNPVQGYCSLWDYDADDWKK